MSGRPLGHVALWALVAALGACGADAGGDDPSLTPFVPADAGASEDAAPAVDAAPSTPEARALAFALALPDLAEAPAARVVYDALGFDAEADGDTDLVVATDDGLRVLLNDGAGRFTLARDPDGEPARPGGRGVVRDLLALGVGPDATPAVLACTSAARELALVATADGLEPWRALPRRAGACRGLAAGDLDGDGEAELATLVERDDVVGLWVTRLPAAGEPQTDERFFAPPDTQPTPVGAATSEVPEAALRFERVPEGSARGQAAAAADFELPAAGEAVFSLPFAPPEWPETIRLQLRVEGGPVEVRPRVVDAEGAVFEGPALDVGADWAPHVLVGVDGWGEPSAEGRPPMAAFALVVRAEGPASGRLLIDEVEAQRAGWQPWLVDDFERRESRFAWPAAAAALAGDLDGDGRADLLVLRGAEPPALLTSGPDGAHRERALSMPEPGTLRQGALLDADADGHLDALLVGDARDRLLVGDGWGRLLDVTRGALPVDWAAGRTVVVRDLDADGVADAVIGNDGATDRLYLGRPDGRFVDATPRLGFDELDTVAVVVADLDGDGDLDVVSLARDGAQRPLLRMAVAP